MSQNYKFDDGVGLQRCLTNLKTYIYSPYSNSGFFTQVKYRNNIINRFVGLEIYAVEK
jgi:hypothetical protein